MGNRRETETRSSPRKGALVFAHRQQPDKHHGCGQACVSMLAPAIVPPSGHLHGPAIVAALGARRTRSAKLNSGRLPLPLHCIVKIKWTGEALGHWVIKDGDVLHDPLKRNGVTWRNGWVEAKGGKITGHIELTPPKTRRRV